MVECYIWSVDVVGSNPPAATNFSPISLLGLERWPFKPEMVTGIFKGVYIMAYTLTSEDREKIIENAYIKHRNYSRSIRGQTVNEQDDLSYWVILETIKFVEEDADILSYHIE